jgi:hypothetical protein
MIKATELRIGNFINWNPKLKDPAITLDAMYVEVTSVMHHKIGYTFPNLEHRVEPIEDDLLQTESRYKQLEELEPIPLTSDLLSKCVFNETADNFRKKDIQEEGGTYVYSTSTFKISITSLHQLQNLYFLLINEELDILL